MALNCTHYRSFLMLLNHKITILSLKRFIELWMVWEGQVIWWVIFAYCILLFIVWICTNHRKHRRMVFKCVHRTDLGVSFCASSQSLQWEEGRESGQVAWSIYLQSERKERLPLLAGGRRVVLINQHDRAGILKSNLKGALTTFTTGNPAQQMMNAVH